MICSLNIERVKVVEFFRQQRDTLLASMLAEFFFILSLLFPSLFMAVFIATAGKKTVAVKTAMKRRGNEATR